MKARITLYTFLFSLLLNSCRDSFLDTKPQGALTPEVLFSNPDNIELLTRSLYGRDWFDYLDKPLYLYGDVLPGNMTTEGGGFALYTTGAFDGSNRYIKSGWEQIYGVITRTNQNIRNLLSLETEIGGEMERVKNKALGESRFFRAYAYSLLVNYWGAVPVVLDNAMDISSSNFMHKRIVEEDVYEVIIRDLTDAIDKLPVTSGPYLTKLSAKALLAKVYLTRAGMSFGSSGDFTKAKELSAEVITNASAAGYGLLADYRDLWVAEYNIRNCDKASNKETLFSWLWDYDAASGDYWGCQNSLQSYFGSDVFTEGWDGWTSVAPSIDLINSWEPGDLRRHNTIMEDGNFYPEFWKDRGGYTYNAYTAYYGTPSYTLSHIRKHLAGRNNSLDAGNGSKTTEQFTKAYTPLIRLADMYLTYAEAVLAKNPSTSDGTALGYFNKIRERAGLAPLPSITFSSLYMERRHEFAFEFVSWADLLRYFRLHPNEVQTMLTNQERGYYQVDDAHNKTLQSFKLPSVTSSFFVFPLPADEVLKDPALREDPVKFDFHKYR